MIGWKVIPRIGIGPVQFSPHGVGIAFGCFVGAWLMARRARARGFDENHAWNTAAWGVVGAIIGARLAYVVGHLDAERPQSDARRAELGGRLACLRVRIHVDVVAVLGKGLGRANQAGHRVDIGVRVDNAYAAHGTLSVLAMVFRS